MTQFLEDWLLSSLLTFLHCWYSFCWLPVAFLVKLTVMGNPEPGKESVHTITRFNCEESSPKAQTQGPSIFHTK